MHSNTPVELSDKSTDEGAWLEARKSLITASDVFSYHTNGDPPPGYEWWDTTAEHIHDEKFNGTEREFPEWDRVHMSMGSVAEGFVLDLVSREFLVNCEGTGKLYGNPRWAHVGASPDGFIWPNRSVQREGETPDGSSVVCAQDRSKNLKVLSAIHGESGPSEGRPWALECKFSTASKWQKEVPLYYWYQVQTQLHVLELDNAVIAAVTVKKKKYPGDKFMRTRWDFKAYHIEKHESFAKVLDSVNERFGKAKEKHESSKVTV